MLAKVRTYDYDEIHPEIKDLLYTANKYVYPMEVVKLLKKMIPEFKSHNSKYEALDREFEANLKTMQPVPTANNSK